MNTRLTAIDTLEIAEALGRPPSEVAREFVASQRLDRVIKNGSSLAKKWEKSTNETERACGKELLTVFSPGRFSSSVQAVLPVSAVAK